jgi:predicted TIM-barrel fold metal-dependent hydrolase
MVIIDSGVHVWRAAGPDRPWQPGREPHLPTPIGYEDLAAMMAEAGVDRAILVPPSWEGERIDYSLEAAAKYPDRFAVMGRIPIDKPEGRKMIETWKDQPGMLGVRLTFHHAWDQDWIKNGVADWFWPAAERLDIPVMMNVPTVLPEVGQVAARHPNLRIIIDHMGRLRGMKDATLRLDKTIALAKHPNVHVKLTLISECTSAEYPYKNIQPEVRRLIDAFSPRRSFWGTDLSVMLSRSSCTYRQAVTLFTEEMGYSPGDLDWLMGRGLAECLPWPIPTTP